MVGNSLESNDVPVKTNTVKFLCSYGGKILPRHPDGKLRYVGGETRVLAVDRSTSFAGLFIDSFICFDFIFLFQFPVKRKGSKKKKKKSLQGFRVRCLDLYRAFGEAWRVMWIVGESEVSVADGRSRRLGVDYLRWGSRQSHRGVRSSEYEPRQSGIIGSSSIKDPSVSVAAQIRQKNISSSVGYLQCRCCCSIEAVLQNLWISFDSSKRGGPPMRPSHLHTGGISRLLREIRRKTLLLCKSCWRKP